MVPLRARARGGLEAQLGDNLSPALAATVVQRLLPPPDRPYFLLSDDGEGGIRLTLFTGAGDPPKLEPHLRFWGSVSAPPPDPDAVQGYPETVREAARVLREASRRAGRRGKEVEAAKATMREFEELVREVRPDLIMPPVDLAALRIAAEGLTALVNHLERNAALLSPRQQHGSD